MLAPSPLELAEQELTHLDGRPFLPELIIERAIGHQKLGTKSADRSWLDEEILVTQQKRWNWRVSHNILLKLHKILAKGL